MKQNSNELSLVIGGKRIYGWDSIRVTRGIERLPSDFELMLMDYYPGSNEKQLVEAGQPCEVLLGDDPVITGYIDIWNSSINKSTHQIRVTGRSKCQDLVDCSAKWPQNVISSATALQISQKLAQGYGIGVTSDVTDMQPVPQFTLNWGESSQEIIDRITRWSAMLYYDTPDGDLLLTRVSDNVAASGVEQGKNVEMADYQSSMNERFSEYSGLSMNVSGLSELSQGQGYKVVEIASAKDPEAEKMRYRNYVTIIESTLHSHQRQQEAVDWEMNRRYGRSKVLKVLVDSWRDISGALWQPNTLIPIHLPVFGLESEQWLLSEVSYVRNKDDGTRAELTLMPPAAFTVQPYEFYETIMETRNYGR
ncbi:phage baseplate assembly protein [Xenorhabdus anantnagensis]|uniref:Contractile injection system protein, VgrG/Pvc8 family n=1 Tax=Xenorhabdus anantnagensis TaxID=3025875 RepID=A0ABT5LWA5_9GAMM|nr:contractile injection system protein, VgrG/Pvc8 family [Xenorhabdus anantnagensis]MDC9598721.1 contractile injection system protein, VgrG/Pvc8 family [Xenorhabdus anantnagensis]